MNSLTRSQYRWELTERRITKKLKMPVLLFLICTTAWLAQMIWALQTYAVNFVYFVN